MHDNQHDDLYNLDSSLKKSSKHLTDEYSKLHKIMERCHKSAQGLNSYLNPLQAKLSSSSSSLDNMLNYTTKSFTANFAKEIYGKSDKENISSAMRSLTHGIGSNIFGNSKGLPGLVEGLFTKLIGGMRAGGGSVAASVPYVVGERGAEVFVPSSSGHIIPNHQLGSKPINVIMNINTTDAESFKRSQTQIFSQAARALQRASKNL